MKVIIAGSRAITEPECVVIAVYKSGFKITEVVSGGAPGVDRLGEWWAASKRLPIRRFLADWKKYGRSAGVIRNGQMAEYADALVAVWDGTSAGTANMIEQMKRAEKPVFVYEVRP